MIWVFIRTIWACSLIPIVKWLDKKAVASQVSIWHSSRCTILPSGFTLIHCVLPDVTYSGLTPAQYGTLILFAIGFTVFMVQRKKKPVRLLERGGAIPYDGYMVTESESITH